MIPLDDQLRPTWLIWKNSPRRLRPGGLLRAGRFRARIRLAQVPGENWLLGAGGELQCHQARLDGRHRRLPECWRHLHRLHDARVPGQIHAFHGCAARVAMLSSSLSGIYGGLIRKLRGITNRTVNKEPKWRHSAPELTTGYDPKNYGNGNWQGSNYMQPNTSPCH